VLDDQDVAGICNEVKWQSSRNHVGEYGFLGALRPISLCTVVEKGQSSMTRHGWHGLDLDQGPVTSRWDETGFGLTGREGKGQDLE